MNFFKISLKTNDLPFLVRFNRGKTTSQIRGKPRLKYGENHVAFVQINLGHLSGNICKH